MLLGAVLLVLLVAAPASAAQTISIGFIADADRAGAYDGAATAVEEGRRAAKAAGLSISLKRATKANGDAAVLIQTIANMRNAGVHYFVLALPGEQVAAAASELDGEDVVLMNAAATEDSLRNERCSGVLFHVAPSDAMRADALEQAGVPNATAQAWSNDSDRFAAAQLKSRFERIAGRPMNSADWAAWLAADALIESAVAARSADPQDVRAHLENPETRFFNYKGASSSFRPWNHQLSQPLYVVAESGVTVVPGPGAEGEAPLDALGASRSESRCRMTR